jgi:hypothetical protein
LLLPLDNDMRDIILIPKVSTGASMPAGRLEADARFWSQLASGLPAFLAVDYLDVASILARRG